MIRQVSTSRLPSITLQSLPVAIEESSMSIACQQYLMTTSSDNSSRVGRRKWCTPNYRWFDDTSVKSDRKSRRRPFEYTTKTTIVTIETNRWTRLVMSSHDFNRIGGRKWCASIWRHDSLDVVASNTYNRCYYWDEWLDKRSNRSYCYSNYSAWLYLYDWLLYDESQARKETSFLIESIRLIVPCDEWNAWNGTEATNQTSNRH